MEKHRISAKVYDPPRATQTLPLPRSGVGALSVTGRPQPTRDPIRERWWAIKSGENRTRWGVPQTARSGRQARRRMKVTLRCVLDASVNVYQSWARSTHRHPVSDHRRCLLARAGINSEGTISSAPWMISSKGKHWKPQGDLRDPEEE